MPSALVGNELFDDVIEPDTAAREELTFSPRYFTRKGGYEAISHSGTESGTMPLWIIRVVVSELHAGRARAPRRSAHVDLAAYATSGRKS